MFITKKQYTAQEETVDPIEEQDLIRNWLAQIPAATGGVALGVGSISKAWLAYALPVPALLVHSIWLSIACAVSLVIGKYLLHPKLLAQDLSCPATCSVLPTTAMASMILATFISPFSLLVGQLIWVTAIALHISLLLVFIYKHSRGFKFSQFVPSWFIPPIGIGVAAVTSPAVQLQAMGQLCLWVALTSFIVLFPAMLFRLSRYQALTTVQKPMLAIMAAPSNLCMAGLVALYPALSIWVLLPLLALSVVMIGLVYGLMLDLLRHPFHPGWAAMTFPLAISTFAQHAAAPLLQQQFTHLAFAIDLFSGVQIILASIIIGYIALRYLSFIKLPYPKS